MLARGKLQFSPLLQTKVSGILVMRPASVGPFSFPKYNPRYILRGPFGMARLH